MFKKDRSILKILKNPIILNSSWGIVAQVLQSIFLSLFFVLIARYYSTEVFASFIIATVLYQLIAALSSLGLSQWFIRELTGKENKLEIINKFLKLQIYVGSFFYIVNIALAFILYHDKLIHILSILLGINVVFDNLINAIKCVNIAEFKQQKTFTILSLDAFLKFTAACLLFVFPLSIISLSLILIIIRFLTLNVFLKLGSSKLISLKSILRCKVSFNYITTLIRFNWPFIILGSVSMLNWGGATVIISKVLTKLDVANYEISYRIFSIAMMLPVVVSATVFPILIKYFKEKKAKEFNSFYRQAHLYYFLFGHLSFTFIYSFIDVILPAVFGASYAVTGIYTKQMFLAILVFPTAFLQANVLISLKLEKMDMWFNVAFLMVNLLCCSIGLYFFKSLTVINISIFMGLLCFHIMQDVVLIRKKVSSRKNVFEFYILSIILIAAYVMLNDILNPLICFLAYWTFIACLYFYIVKWPKINRSYLLRKLRS
jgi:O-antigen/teichoic acid export membrane protein